MEQFERIRRDHRDEGLSVRALAARHRVHRRTVRQALADAVPPAPRAPRRVSPVLGPYEATVRGWLVADRDAPRKQRHTARRVWQRLIEEEGAQVGRVERAGAGRRAEGRGRGWTAARSRSPRHTCRGWRPRSTSGSSGR